MELDGKEFILGHGKSTFIKPEKVAKMERESAGGQLVIWCIEVRIW